MVLTTMTTEINSTTIALKYTLVEKHIQVKLLTDMIVTYNTWKYCIAEESSVRSENADAPLPDFTLFTAA
jgi:hypothetical protein